MQFVHISQQKSVDDCCIRNTFDNFLLIRNLYITYCLEIQIKSRMLLPCPGKAFG